MAGNADKEGQRPPPDFVTPISTYIHASDHDPKDRHEPGDQSGSVNPLVSPTQMHENEETVITSIRATGITIDLPRLPSSFYAIVQHSGCEWRTENKSVSVNDDIEWGGLILCPPDVTTSVCLLIYASFEVQPVLGSGEEIRVLTATVKELLDRSANNLSFTFRVEDDGVVSLCSSVFVTLKPKNREISDPPGSRVPDPCRTATELQDQLEDATNEGHRALSRFRRHNEEQDLERSIEQFERALNLCPQDHPCHAVTESNLAMAKFIHFQIDPSSQSLHALLTLYRNALVSRPVGHPDRPSTLIRLAIAHFAPSVGQQCGSDAIEAEELLHEAMKLTPAGGHEKRAAIFLLEKHRGRQKGRDGLAPQLSAPTAAESGEEDPLTLGVQLWQRFRQSDNIDDLQRAVTLLETAVYAASTPDQRYHAASKNLGTALLDRFKRLGEPNDLDEATSRCRIIVNFMPNGDPQKLAPLIKLRSCLSTRFQRLGKLDDLEELILREKDVIELTPDNQPSKSCHVNYLGRLFLIRFQRHGESRDLEQAIPWLREAVAITPDGHYHRLHHLDDLCHWLKVRFDLLGNLDDLGQAILHRRDLVHLTPDSDPEKPCRSNILGACLFKRFERCGEMSDLEEAISRQRDSVMLTPDGHSHRLGHLIGLGLPLQARFDRCGQLDDLEKAISTWRNIISSATDNDTEKPCYLEKLGDLLLSRFRRLGELSDLEEAISRHRDAITLMPDGLPHKLDHLADFANSLRARFSCLGELGDLELAISICREVVDSTPDNHPAKNERREVLGVSLLSRFRRLGELNDLEEAISIQRHIIALTPDALIRKPQYLMCLSEALMTRFSRLEDLGDLQEAISNSRVLVNAGPDEPCRHGSLGMALLSRFSKLGELNDLEEGISRLRDAVTFMPDGHPHRLNHLIHLGNSLHDRFHRLGEKADHEQAMSLYSQVACASIGPTSDRFKASLRWISCARSLGHESYLHAYSVAISLLPQLAWIGLSLTDRYRELVQGADLVREAAAAALNSGHPETAVEWLEQGRSIVWSELFQLRSSYEELSSAYPDHARRLRDLSSALEHAGIEREKSLSSKTEQTQCEGHCATESPSLEQEATRHRSLAIDRDKLLQEIRGLPGFERFLLHKEFSQLRTSAHSGPVVLLNAAKDRCDALVVRADKESPVHVSLPNFPFGRSVHLRNALKNLLRQARVVTREKREGKPEPSDCIGWESLLSSLWSGVVKPVLDALDISTPGELSRIFWCPTGPFVFLPIHAAGLYGVQYMEPGNKVSDFVISSYAPTLSSLAPSPKSDTAPSETLRLLAVRQPLSDGQSRLPGVNTELRHIQDVIENSPSSCVTLVESNLGTVEEVLGQMKEADWCHFACHGIQDAASPTDSGLCLADGRRLKLSDIIALSRPRGGLAFLSACQTATGDGKLSDEAIHIAAGMLFAGYAGVVGTMWSISDHLAPYVTRDVYERLLGSGTRPDYREAARALHDAVRCLWEDGEVSFVDWLPFIHVGL